MVYDYLNWPREKGKLSIAMVCDFFYPNAGGVETHIYSLAQCLIQRGHRVTVITHSYGSNGNQRQGIRYMSRGLKVYYVPLVAFFKQTVFFTLFGTLSITREILIREQVDLVHGHSSFSCFSHEVILHAQSLGLRTIMTDHSLFGFADLSSVTMNKVLECVVSALDYVICVSHICKENSVLRTRIQPDRVYVIPNAIDADQFTPDISARDLNYVTIVVVSRLVYRKGIDLLVAIIPAICALFPQVRFLIGGDGPKQLDLEELRERHRLHSRVKLVGALHPESVRSVLVQGDIFLNTSLTEAFCMAILEAVACGLLVVSTSVGGIPEVLPNEFIRLSSVRPSDLAKCLSEAIKSVLAQRQLDHAFDSEGDDCAVKSEVVPSNEVDEPLVATPCATNDSIPGCFSNNPKKRASFMHQWVRQAYSWSQVAERTEAVYRAAMAGEPLNFNRLLRRLSNRGGRTSLVLIIVALIHWLFLNLLCWLRPEKTICRVPYLIDPSEKLSETNEFQLIQPIAPGPGASKSKCGDT